MNRLLFVKLYRDLMSTWGRTMMMVTAIAVSLVAFGTMLFAYALEQSNATSGYLSTNPASARITLHPEIQPEKYRDVIEAAEQEPGVIDASVRTVTSVKIPVEDGKTEPLQLYVAPADDPMDVARFEIEEGTWPPKEGEVLLERASLKSLGLKVGDKLKVLGFDGRSRELKIAGSVHDQSLALAGTEGGVGYATDKTLASFLGGPGLNQVVITVADAEGQTNPTMNRDAIVATAQKVANRVEAVSGAEVEEIAVPMPGEHPHQSVANSLLAGLLAFGILSLLLSSILIATMFNAMLTQQIPQIGVMKTIGADTGSVLKLYLAMALIIAVSATVIAFVPALVFGEAMAQMLLSGAMNIDVANLSVSWWVYLIYIASGILVPLVIALVPLVRAAQRTVRSALDHHGTIETQGRVLNRLFTALSKIRRADKMLLMAFRNLFRRRGRFILSLSLLATAGAIFIAGMSVMDGFRAIPSTVLDSNKWDAQVTLGSPAPAAKIAAATKDIPGVVSVEAWNMTETSLESPGKNTVTQTYPDQGHGKARLTAIPADTAMFTPPKIVEGRWLEPNETSSVVLPKSARNTLPLVKVGDRITLPIDDQKTTWQVVGIASELAGGSCPCVTMTGLEKATGASGANTVRIVTENHDKQSRTDVIKAVAAKLNQASIKTSGPQTIDRVMESTEGHSDLLVILILLISLVIGVVGLIGLNSMMSTSVIERTREFGVMKSIGAPASSVMRLVIFEGIFTAFISFLVAVIPALALTGVIGSNLGEMFFSAPIPFVTTWQTFAIWVAILIVGTTLATLAPAARASRLTVREAISYL